jgi:tryptophanyl-tRNA synthetase
VSGIQPTGSLHLGNYFGALKQWTRLQDLYDTFFCAVDLHAITSPHNPQELISSTKKSVALYIACGIDPNKATVFVQSHVPAHSELAWLLNCIAPIGWAERMIQYKEKARKHGENVSVGLFDYPILMAADILLYNADLVPVGEDQRQHLELAQNIAERTNHLFGGQPWKRRKGKTPSGRKRGGDVFKVPDSLIPPQGARVMSLADGTDKMSKSDPSELSRIELLDDPNEIRRKVKRCKTDSHLGLEADNPDRPEAANLLSLYQLSTGMSQDEALRECADLKWADFKPRLAEALIECLRPIQESYEEVTKDQSQLDSILANAARKAQEVAIPTLLDVRDAMGFTEPPAEQIVQHKCPPPPTSSKSQVSSNGENEQQQEEEEVQNSFYSEQQAEQPEQAAA